MFLRPVRLIAITGRSTETAREGGHKLAFSPNCEGYFSQVNASKLHPAADVSSVLIGLACD